MQPPAIRALTATRIGGVVALLDDGRLMRLDASGAPAGEVRLAEDIGRAAALAPGGGVAVAASQGSRQIGVYTCGSDVEQCEGKPIAEGFASAVAISDDGEAAAVAVEKEGVVRTDLSGATPVTTPVTLDGNPRILSLAFDPAGTTLAAGAADGRVFLIDAEGGVREIIQPEGSATALAFASDGSRLAASCGGPDICIYALGGDEPVLVDRLRGHANTVLDLAWSEDGAALASASVDGSIKYWTSEGIDPTAFVMVAPDRAPLTDVALSPDGRLLAAGGDAGSVAVFDMTAKAPAGVLSSGREAEVRSLRWSPDKPWLAAVDEDGFLTVRDWPEGELVEERRIDESVVESVRWTPDGKALLVATLGGAVRIWPLGGAPADFDGLHPEPVLALALLPDGKRVVSTDALGNVWLWDIAARTRIETSWTPADAAVDTAVVSNGGRRLLVAGNGGVLYLYDLETPGAPVRIDTGARQIDGAAWSPDDAKVAAVDTDGNLKVYSVADGRLWAAAQIYPTGAGDDDDGAHLRRMLWLPGSSAVAIATSAGEVAVVTLDQPAWLARARSVFGLPEPVVKAAPADGAPAE